MVCFLMAGLGVHDATYRCRACLLQWLLPYILEWERHGAGSQETSLGNITYVPQVLLNKGMSFRGSQVASRAHNQQVHRAGTAVLSPVSWRTRPSKHSFFSRVHRPHHELNSVRSPGDANTTFLSLPLVFHSPTSPLPFSSLLLFYHPFHSFLSSFPFPFIPIPFLLFPSFPLHRYTL